ncbi:MAG: 50S ribosomal protein L4 [Deltaproteobacteria bacterium]|nr:50S ribosomal protein L4 [Deltaproteobacteria bacterium]
MTVLDVYNINREKVSQIEVDESVFDAEVKEHLFYEIIRAQLASRRSGTACTKTRGDVSGGGRKPWKQKGTGRARSGSSRSPLWRGGGVAFGPRPRDYGYPVPKKVKRVALCSALTKKLKEDKLLIVDKFELPEIKTRAFKNIMAKLAGRRALIIDDENRNLSLSARNLPDVKVLPSQGLNLYDILYYDGLLITLPSLDKIQRRLAA